jgi:hypothetical protein
MATWTICKLQLSFACSCASAAGPEEFAIHIEISIGRLGHRHSLRTIRDTVDWAIPRRSAMNSRELLCRRCMRATSSARYGLHDAGRPLSCAMLVLRDQHLLDTADQFLDLGQASPVVGGYCNGSSLAEPYRYRLGHRFSATWRTVAMR